MSVTTPTPWAPLTVTLAPMIGSPVASFTTPVTFDWANARLLIEAATQSIANFFIRDLIKGFVLIVDYSFLLLSASCKARVMSAYRLG